MLNCTKTVDEQDETGNPIKPFPDKPYFKPVLQAMDNETTLFIEKSRTMMLSWTGAAWAMHKMGTRPATGVLVQSEDEDRATNFVKYAKALWEQSTPEIQARWQPKGGRLPGQQPYNEFHLANKSWIKGIPGNPDKVRSEHPFCVIFDEAAHMTMGEAAFNIAQATRCKKIFCISSAKPGWFRDLTKDAQMEHWPYTDAENAA